MHRENDGETEVCAECGEPTSPGGRDVCAGCADLLAARRGPDRAGAMHYPAGPSPPHGNTTR